MLEVLLSEAQGKVRDFSSAQAIANMLTAILMHMVVAKLYSYMKRFRFCFSYILFPVLWSWSKAQFHRALFIEEPDY